MNLSRKAHKKYTHKFIKVNMYLNKIILLRYIFVCARHIIDIIIYFNIQITEENLHIRKKILYFCFAFVHNSGLFSV